MTEESQNLLLNYLFILEEDKTEECEICCEKQTNETMTSIGNCAHKYCYKCLQIQIKTQVLTGNLNFICPYEKCTEKCKIEMFNFMMDLNFENESDMENLDWLYCQFCKTCLYYVQKQGEPFRVQCTKKFCLGNFNSKTKLFWNQLTEQDIQISKQNRLLGYMKCPKCLTWVEKTEGCDNMVCKCTFNFCYKCGGPKSTPSQHNCNVYMQNDKEKMGYWYYIQ